MQRGKDDVQPCVVIDLVSDDETTSVAQQKAPNHQHTGNYSSAQTWTRLVKPRLNLEEASFPQHTTSSVTHTSVKQSSLVAWISKPSRAQSPTENNIRSHLNSNHKEKDADRKSPIPKIKRMKCLGEASPRSVDILGRKEKNQPVSTCIEQDDSTFVLKTSPKEQSTVPLLETKVNHLTPRQKTKVMHSTFHEESWNTSATQIPSASGIKKDMNEPAQMRTACDDVNLISSKRSAYLPSKLGALSANYQRLLGIASPHLEKIPFSSKQSKPGESPGLKEVDLTILNSSDEEDEVYTINTSTTTLKGKVPEKTIKQHRARRVETCSLCDEALKQAVFSRCHSKNCGAAFHIKCALDLHGTSNCVFCAQIDDSELNEQDVEVFKQLFSALRPIKNTCIDDNALSDKHPQRTRLEAFLKQTETFDADFKAITFRIEQNMEDEDSRKIYTKGLMNLSDSADSLNQVFAHYAQVQQREEAQIHGHSILTSPSKSTDPPNSTQS